MSTILENEVTHPARKPAHAAASPSLKKKLNPLFHRYKKPAMIAAGIVASLFVLFYAYDAYTHEETDDAYVTGHLHEISSRINGVVTDVLVDDNQKVKEGDVLVKLDPSEYEALEAAAKADLANAQSNLDRQAPLVAMHAIAPEDVDKTENTRDVDLAQEKLAELQIVYSTIKAPATGYVGRKNVEVGNRVSSGQTLLVVVEPDLWVVANFKETQLARMHPGQPVEISIDAIPGKVFQGRVDSFSPATGNEFALLPADNSTGNFTKIVQRVPVKVTFDPDSIRGYEERIRVGESAVVKVALTDPAKK
ncbi:MAG: HlyD family secretion protein [Methylacidiphilales bacterium]|nr:HlyD family secretion protein [Candidatus Methylacidiphilales bacterium]